MKLKNTLYGIRQIPRSFWKYLSNKCEACDLKQFWFYPYLFVVETVIFIVYVDDIILWGINDDNIYDMKMELQELGIDLEQEDDTASFLGVTLERDLKTVFLEMK